jgi:formamidopyrimidine-DNA glycosylase
MPELPEVDAAASILRRIAQGKMIASVDVRHAAHRRVLGPAHVARLAGARVEGIERRGKHQLVRLADGAILHVHFRMTGDWASGSASEPIPPYARVVITFTDQSWVALVDPRALSTVTLHDRDPLPALGPDATDASFTPQHLAVALASRRVAIKPALLDQKVVAGLGNIYAAEALWLARIDPRRRAASLTAAERTRLVGAIRRTLRRATRSSGRYSNGAPSRFAVYDREGRACRRCGTPIARIVQAGRSTYWCPGCQRRAVSPAPRRSRPSSRRSRGS